MYCIYCIDRYIHIIFGWWWVIQCHFSSVSFGLGVCKIHAHIYGSIGLFELFDLSTYRPIW